MSFYYLEVIRGTETGRKFFLPDGAISIGRDTQNTIVLCLDKSVSGHHAIIYKSPERILIEDLQSTNGTYINEEKIAAQKDLVTGDEVGFGKTGPRLKIIVSDHELDTSAPEVSGEQEDFAVKTLQESGIMMKSDDSTSKEDQNTISMMKQSTSFSPDSLNPSMTFEYEKKLMQKSINSDEMQKLMKDGKRLEKILNKGSLGDDQTSMLRTVYHANKSMQKKWFYLLTVILIVSITISAYFAIRSFQYKALVDKAQTLRKDLQAYEKKIAMANNNPEQNKDQLEKMITELEEKQKSLSNLKSQINEGDFGKFYSDPLERRIDEILMRLGESDYHIPEEMVQRVRYHIDIYSGRMKNVITRYLERKEKYFPMIHKVFREKNLPLELSYVSMLESGFNTMALSHAGARGLWQFMPHTGRRYGLKVNDKIDDRTDPLKSTYAAAEYFKDLISIFGGKSSVMLCMAAYNAGEGRVIGALRKIEDPMRNRDFWYIYRMGYLAEETNEYIPRVISLMIISENPDEYGFGKGPSNNDSQLESENDFIEVDLTID
ncbi:MAG TPA: transglycosylase SLT domain-containing protein [Chitinispirillaceae bacterium]|nr:transglycosylase SLT domain-containing protein [Chitinispirillaceae bacterium]